LKSLINASDGSPIIMKKILSKY